MPEVLEIEQTENMNEVKDENSIASWLIEIPGKIIDELNLQKGSRIALTVKNGEVSGDILPPLSDKLKTVSNHILEKNRKFYEELKRLGD